MKNKSESHGVAACIGILSFLWDVPSRRLGFWLVGSFLGIQFLIFSSFVERFIVKLAQPTVQVLILLLPIG